MRLSLHQLNVLLKIKQTGSMTQAGKALHMTQPAVSNIVKQLEDIYSVKLTKHVQRQAELITAGQIVAHLPEQVERLVLESENLLSSEQTLLYLTVFP